MSHFDLVLQKDRKPLSALNGRKVRTQQNNLPDVSMQGFLSVPSSLNPPFLCILKNAHFPHLPYLFSPAFIPFCIFIIVLFKFVTDLHSYCINDPILTKLNYKEV